MSPPKQLRNLKTHAVSFLKSSTISSFPCRVALGDRILKTNSFLIPSAAYDIIHNNLYWVSKIRRCMTKLTNKNSCALFPSVQGPIGNASGKSNNYIYIYCTNWMCPLSSNYQWTAVDKGSITNCNVHTSNGRCYGAKLKYKVSWSSYHIPSRELTNPTLGKGKSSSKCHFGGIC